MKASMREKGETHVGFGYIYVVMIVQSAWYERFTTGS